MTKVKERVTTVQSNIRTLPPPTNRVPPNAGGPPAPPTRPSNSLTGTTGIVGDTNRPTYGLLNSIRKEALFHGLLAETAYMTNTDELDAVKSALGNCSYTRILQNDAICPDGIRWNFPDANTIVFAIQGTTKDSQVHLYQSTQGMQPLAIRCAAGGPNISSTNNNQEINGDTPGYFGYWYYPFISASGKWLQTVSAALYDEPGQKNVVVCGHSLGAAVCQYIAAYASVVTGRVFHPAELVQVGNPSNQEIVKSFGSQWERFQGGWGFGSPNVMDFGSTKVRGHTGGVSSVRDQGFNAWPYTNKTRLFKRANLPPDPIRFIPATFSGTPWYLYAGNATVGRFVPRQLGPVYEISGSEEFFRNFLRAPVSLPGTAQEMKARILQWHPIRNYQKFLNGAIVTSVDGWNEAWQAAYNAVTTATQIETLTGFDN